MKSQKFGDLLTEAIWRIKGRTSKPIKVIQEELGFAMGKTGDASLEYWRQGHIPSELADLEALTKNLAQQTDFEPAWFEKFLKYGGHPQPKRFCRELFPPPESPPPLAAIVYLKPQVDVRRVNTDSLIPAQFAMPLYRGDIIYAHVNALAHLICSNGLLFEATAESNLTITCQNNTGNKRIIGRWDAVLSEQFLHFPISPVPVETNLADLAKAEATIQNMALEEHGRAYMLAQLYRGRGMWEAAIGQLEWLTNTKKITSAYLSQQLGDLYLMVDLYTRAEENYQLALMSAKVATDKIAQIAAHTGLERAAYALRKAKQETFLDYVRFLAEEIISIIMAPRQMANSQEEAAGFLAEIKAQGLEFGASLDFGQALSFRGNEAIGPLEVVAVTYATTQSIIENLSLLEIETQISKGLLPTTLQRQAEKTAKKLGFIPDETQTFAPKYAALVAQDPDMLRDLMMKRP